LATKIFFKKLHIPLVEMIPADYATRGQLFSKGGKAETLCVVGEMMMVMPCNHSSIATCL
jgi:hypothetical protein